MATFELTEICPSTPLPGSSTPPVLSCSEPPPSLTLSNSSIASPISDTADSLCDRFSAPIPFRRRGFLRPQATTFADSTRNRQSVMSLGSIAHIQHYFARTGLLEGKGGHLAQDSIKIVSEDEKENTTTLIESFQDAMTVSADTKTHYPPPTLSLYRQVPVQTAPPPSLEALRLELREALADAKSVLAGLQPSETIPQDGTTSSQGWHEVEGTHVLDLVTLALRSAKEYYVCHTCPSRLFALRSERQLRADAHNVMDTLKIVASRNFRGGFRTAEIEMISLWITGIEKLVDCDEKEERTDRSRHDRWPWMYGNWTNRERDREWTFLKCFDIGDSSELLGAWLEPIEGSSEPTNFLTKLMTGIKLIKLHNAMVQASKRRFGMITTYYSNTDKPYRRSENLKYWIKAAELRWDIKLDIPVLAIASGGDHHSWKMFDKAILQWCKTVREELTAEYGGLT